MLQLTDDYNNIESVRHVIDMINKFFVSSWAKTQ